jgi:hypothetical protein
LISHWNKNSVNYHWPHFGAVSFKNIQQCLSLQLSGLFHIPQLICVNSHFHGMQPDTKYQNRLDTAPKHEGTGIQHHSKFSVTCWQEETTPFLTLIQDKMTWLFLYYYCVNSQWQWYRNPKNNYWNYGYKTKQVTLNFTKN